MGANGNWLEVRLGDLVQIKHGWPFKSQFFNEELTGRPIVVNIGNFRYTGGFRFESTTVKEYRDDYPEEYELAARDVLLAMTCQTSGGEILGIPGRIPDDQRVCLHNQRLGKVVVTNPSMAVADYLYWLFSWSEFNRYLFNTASGTKILHTSPGRIESFRFRLPKVAEQVAIASTLDALNDKIDLNRRMNATLEAMARALFQAWFVDFEPVRAKKGAWKTRKLGDVAAINARSIKGEYPYPNIEYIDISAVTEGRLEGTTPYSPTEAPSRAQRLVQHGDTIWSCVRPNRRSYYFIHEPVPNLVVSTGFAVLTAKHVTS